MGLTKVLYGEDIFMDSRLGNGHKVMHMPLEDAP